MTERHNCVNVWAGAAIELFKRLQQAEESLEEAKTVIGNLEEENRKLNLELIHTAENNAADRRLDLLHNHNTALKFEVEQLKYENESLVGAKTGYEGTFKAIWKSLSQVPGLCDKHNPEWMGVVVQRLVEQHLELLEERDQIEEALQVDKNGLLKRIDNLIDQVGRLGSEVNALDNWNASLEHTVELLEERMKIEIDVPEDVMEVIKMGAEHVGSAPEEYVKDLIIQSMRMLGPMLKSGLFGIDGKPGSMKL